MGEKAYEQDQCEAQSTTGQCNTAYNPDAWANDLFTYHRPRPDQVPKYEAIREAAKYFAKLILANTPPCADQSDAIRKLRETVMTANAAIALDGR